MLKTKIGSLWLTREEFRRATPSVLRGTVLGSVLGILPGGGAALSAFGSYMLERKVSKYRHEFGNGAIEGKMKISLFRSLCIKINNKTVYI